MEYNMTIGTDQAPARSLIEIEAEIMAQKRTIGRSIVVIGQALREAKGQLAHGAWGDWLRDRVNFSQGTAENYMRIAEQVHGESTLLDLPYTKILALLAVPETEREQFAQDNQVEDKSVSEIKRLIRERDEALDQIKTLMHSAAQNAHEATQANMRAERAENQVKAEKREQERLTAQINREREHVAELLAREPDTVTIEREVPPSDYEEIKRANEAIREELDEATETIDALSSEIDALRSEQEDARDPLAVGPFCDACAALLNALYAAPYAKAFFETCTDADLERYSTNIGLILKWASETQDVVDSIRADRLPDEQCFTLHL